MSVSLLLEMAASSNPDRTAIVSGSTLRLTTQQLSDLADGGAGVIAASGAQHVVYVGAGGAMLPLLIFAAARAGLAFTPLNYRLSAEGIAGADRAAARTAGDRRRPVPRHGRVTPGAGDGFRRVPDGGAQRRAAHSEPSSPIRTRSAIVLFTSGTTSQPKAVELSHNNLTSYITGTVEFESAGADDAALICVPPYHIAGVSAALSNLYAGRKMVYLPNFDADRMGAAGQRRAGSPPRRWCPPCWTASSPCWRRAATSCRRCATWPTAVRRWVCRWCARALELLPGVGFVNAYGLTETSSTIAVLTPDDHRAAHAAISSGDAAAAKRLGSVGQPVPGIELQIRDDEGKVLGPGETGELFVRGEQVSGRYTGIGSVLDENGWFPTKDIALLDEEGYLFIGGRSDDTIIRGGENIAPAELEEVLIEHAHVRDVAVVGVEDPQWGQAIVAVVVPAVGIDPDPEELREHVRKSLRGSRTPDRVVFRDELPTTPTGKVLRREIIETLEGARRMIKNGTRLAEPGV